ncbi:hypothetical protein JVU11DRAFT_8322 [Chiua virens]|nr:hypothetical protein JVU11DRAFT_8322 [Chiua virens]
MATSPSQDANEGTIFTCESCSKVYRHPSCLIKHRWEHTPQWREASKFVLSKHQQVQLLEAAAILAHLSPSSASLPEDRSLWPSFLSGGLVPPPASVPNSDLGPISVPTATTTTSSSASSAHTLSSFPVSSSVPARMSAALSTPTAPRLHDYAIDEDTAKLTQVRPGMLAMNGNDTPIGVSAASASVPVPVPVTGTREDDALNLLALYSSGGHGSWESPTSPRSHTRSHSYSVSQSRSAMTPSHAHAHSLSLSHGLVGGGGWSLPRSSVRFRSKSKSDGSERSRSASQSVSAEETRSDDEDQDQEVGVGVFGEADMDEDEQGMFAYGSCVHTWNNRAVDHEAEVGVGGRAGEDKGAREQTWDGMEMEMEME